MLTHIYIKNLTIIEELTLDLSAGLSMITGETGAGKSIWVDAVQLALGARADIDMIRPGCARGEITLCFDLNAIDSAKNWLHEQALENEHDTHECVIRRVIDRNIKNRCTINGRPVSLNTLHEFAEKVLTIHSQHKQQTLLKEEGQQQQIDQFANLGFLLSQTKQLFNKWQELEQEKIVLTNKLNNRKKELEWLQYQLEELQTLAPISGEWQQLLNDYQQLSHSESHLNTLNNILNTLQEKEQGATASTLHQANVSLKSLKQIFPQINSIQELLNQADIYLQEAIIELQHLQSNLEINPEKLKLIEIRLNKIQDLARKHQVQPEVLYEVLSILEKKIAELNEADQKIVTINSEQKEITDQYHIMASEISARRLQAATKISEKVTSSMQQLGMKGGYFKVELLARNHPIHPLGSEKIRFLVSTNPGQPIQPLQKIVSGGELSRIHLALQVFIAEKAETPTLIFDEVDVGIGGKVAAIVGDLLRQLSQNTQVICITHLPQVAAYGHQHYQVNKQSKQEQTFSQIIFLNSDDRIEELARMLGGAQITAQTRAYAAELLNIE